MRRALSFLGAAGTVTGSCYLLDVDGQRLLVDCGVGPRPRSGDTAIFTSSMRSMSSFRIWSDRQRPDC
jgi:predicted metal-dependent RNase